MSNHTIEDKEVLHAQPSSRTHPAQCLSGPEIGCGERFVHRKPDIRIRFLQDRDRHIHVSAVKTA